MKVTIKWLVAWIICAVALMYAGMVVCLLGSMAGEYMLLCSVIMLPCTFVLAEHLED